MKNLAVLAKRLKRYWQRSRGVVYRKKHRLILKDWFQRPYGESLLKAEQQALDDLLPGMFGFHLLQLSAIPGGLSTKASTINHRYVFSPLKEERTSTISTFELLPLPSDCIDVCLLHHALEFSSNPHQLLRETARVTIPHGHIVIISYNPWSLWGLVKQFRRIVGGKTDSRYHDLTCSRILDWLRLLDFTPVSVHCTGYTPPIQSLNWQKRFTSFEHFSAKRQLFGSSIKVIVARKEVTIGSPLHSRWESLRPKLGFGVAKTSGFVHNRSSKNSTSE